MSHEITAHLCSWGDPGAGIPSERFDAGPFNPEDSEDRERIREELARAFGEICGSAVEVRFDDEIPHLDLDDYDSRKEDPGTEISQAS